MKRVVLSVLCLAGLSAAAYSLDEKGFVRDWLVSGPWPSRVIQDVDQGLKIDHLTLETEVEPFAGKPERSEFIADWGLLVASVGSVNEWGFKTNTTYDATWRELHADAGIVIFTKERFAPIEDHYVAYMACYVDLPEAIDAQIRVGSDDDHKVFLDRRLVGTVTASQGVVPGNFKYDVRLPKGLSRLLVKLQDRTGDCGFCVQLTDRAGQPLKDVKIELEPRGRQTTLAAELAAERTPERLRERLACARKREAAAVQALALAEAERETLSNACVAAERSLDEAYRLREAAYAAQHAAAAAKGRKSVAEPIECACRRSTLCLNGFWESSVDDGKTWGKSRVPCRQLDDYFYKWVYPSREHAAFKDLFDPLNVAARGRVRTTFAWDGEGEVIFRCDAINGLETEVYVNGSLAGTWNGDRGIVRVPLSSARKGVNTLELRTVRLRGFHDRNGLRGDLFVEFVPSVRADEVWVRPSWRESALGVESKIVNNGRQPVIAQVETFAVKGGRVRFRLSPQRVTVPAGGCAEVRQRDAWADPELWDFANPSLYTLVTDVRVDGRIVDRHEEEFGFREFWICHTDFFLNGKRTLLTGDVGFTDVDDKRRREIVWELSRRDGFNLFRVHDSDQWSITAVRDADRMGHAICAQMYPKFFEKGAKHTPKAFSPFETWTQTQAHRENLAAYTRWWEDLRNHPSVLIWSTDNETVTQANDKESQVDFNIRNERVAALYEKYMQSLDPDLVLTRDGDIGTWNRKQRWYENPPCVTANYHYPNFDNANWAENWQSVYEYRPVIFGEALYCMYFQNGWVGAKPNLVEDKVRQVRQCAPLYTRLGVPCVVYMGISSDGFICLDDSGKGNPWGLRASDMKRYFKTHELPPGRRADQYPDFRIDWPAYSGEGERLPSVRVNASTQGYHALNIYDSAYPSHVRTAVNDEYRAGLRPQPPIKPGRYAEVVVTAESGADVWTATPAGNRLGMRADTKGRAWFRALEPGHRTFVSGNREKAAEIPPRGDDALKPGFVNMPRLSLLEAQPKPVANLRGANPIENFFRKSVSLAQRPRRAVARIYADTGYELFVNGRLVASLQEWANMRDYDLTTFVVQGANQLAIRASNRSGHRGLAFELMADGRQVAVTDDSWKTFPEERWGWTLGDFDDSCWAPPQIMDLGEAGGPQWSGHPGDESVGVVPTLEGCPFFTGAIPKGVDSPFYRAKPSPAVELSKELIEVAGTDYAKAVMRPLPTLHSRATVMKLNPGSGTAVQTGDVLRLTAPDRWTGPSFVVDLGEQVVGYFRLRVASKGPVAFRTRQAESLSEALTEPDRREPLHRMLCHEYRLEKGVQEFESRDRMGGRFVRVEFFDTPEPVEVSGFSLRWSLYPVRRIGYFSCNDEIVNEAWRAAERTLLLNMQEFHLDAIKRDRMLWVADARGEQLANYAIFGDTDLFEFCWRKMAECQYASGAMPSSFGKGLSVIWDFNAWYVIALDDYIEWTGRTDFPASLAPNVIRVTDWMLARTGSDGLLDVPENPIAPLWMVCLNGAKGKDTFINALFLKMLRGASRVCRAAGETSAAERFAAHADRIEPGVNALHAASPLEARGGNLFPPPVFHFTLDHMARSGNVAGAYALLYENMKRMLASGAGVLPENMPVRGPEKAVLDESAGLGSGSLCHGWQALLADFLLRHVAGLSPLEPGWKKVAFRPNPCGLRSFVAVAPTPLGPLAVSYDGSRYALSIPRGMTVDDNGKAVVQKHFYTQQSPYGRDRTH